MTRETDETTDTGEFTGDPRDVSGMKAHMLRLLAERKRERAKSEALLERVRQLEAAAAIRGHRERPGEQSSEALTPREALLHAAAERVALLDGAAYAAELEKIRAELEPLLEAEATAARTSIAEKYAPEVAKRKASVERLVRQNAAQHFITQHRRPGIAAMLLEPIVLPRFATTWTHAGECIASPVDGEGAPISPEALAAELQGNPALGPLLQGASPEELERRRLLVREAFH